MTVLAIDTSSRRRIVCVLTDPHGHVQRAETRDDADIDAVLPVALASLLDGRLGHVVVVIGPGSYTGIRAGMAAALGIAHARSLPLHGVSGFEVIAAAAAAQGGAQGWALIDAGRGGAYAARFEGGAVAPGWSRVDVAEFSGGDLPVYSADPLAGARRLEPPAALAAAVPAALAAAPLARDALQPLYPA